MAKVTRFLPATNWTGALIEFIRDSKAGDEIVMSTGAQKELAHRAIMRICPEKKVIFTVITEDEWNAPLESGRALPKKV